MLTICYIVGVWTENGWESREFWGNEISSYIRCGSEGVFIKGREREAIVEEGEVPVGGVPFVAWIFEGQRVYSPSL